MAQVPPQMLCLRHHTPLLRSLACSVGSQFSGDQSTGSIGLALSHVFGTSLRQCSVSVPVTHEVLFSLQNLCSPDCKLSLLRCDENLERVLNDNKPQWLRQDQVLHILQGHDSLPGPLGSLGGCLAVPMLSDSNMELAASLLIAAEKPGQALWDAWDTHSVRTEVVGVMLFGFTQCSCSLEDADRLLTNAVLLATMTAPYVATWGAPHIVAVAKSLGLFEAHSEAPSSTSTVLTQPSGVSTCTAVPSTSRAVPTSSRPPSAQSLTSEELDVVPELPSLQSGQEASPRQIRLPRYDYVRYVQQTAALARAQPHAHQQQRNPRGPPPVQGSAPLGTGPFTAVRHLPRPWEVQEGPSDELPTGEDSSPLLSAAASSGLSSILPDCSSGPPPIEELPVQLQAQSCQTAHSMHPGLPRPKRDDSENADGVLLTFGLVSPTELADAAVEDGVGAIVRDAAALRHAASKWKQQASEGGSHGNDLVGRQVQKLQGLHQATGAVATSPFLDVEAPQLQDLPLQEGPPGEGLTGSCAMRMGQSSSGASSSNSVIATGGWKAEWNDGAHPAAAAADASKAAAGKLRRRQAERGCGAAADKQTDQLQQLHATQTPGSAVTAALDSKQVQHDKVATEEGQAARDHVDEINQFALSRHPVTLVYSQHQTETLYLQHRLTNAWKVHPGFRLCLLIHSLVMLYRLLRHYPYMLLQRSPTLAALTCMSTLLTCLADLFPFRGRRAGTVADVLQTAGAALSSLLLQPLTLRLALTQLAADGYTLLSPSVLLSVVMAVLVRPMYGVRLVSFLWLAPWVWHVSVMLLPPIVGSAISPATSMDGVMHSADVSSTKWGTALVSLTAVLLVFAAALRWAEVKSRMRFEAVLRSRAPDGLQRRPAAQLGT